MQVKDIVEFFGSRPAAIEALRISRQTLKNWEDTGVPWLPQLAVQALSQSKLKADPKAR